MTKIGSILLGLSAILMPSTIFAQEVAPSECALKFAQRNATITLLATDIGNGETATGQVSVEVFGDTGGSTPATCAGTIRVSRISLNNDIPGYRLSHNGRQLEPSTNEVVGSPSNQFPVEFPASKVRRDYEFRVVAPMDWGIGNGNYTEQLQLSLVDRSGQTQDRMTLTIDFSVPRAVDIMVVGASSNGRTAQLDLGELSNLEATRSSLFGVRVWSTSGYYVTLDSENDGVLRHALAMDNIPYKLLTEGRQADLRLQSIIATSGKPSASSGDFYGMQIIVPARVSVAGQYSDRLVFSVTAL